MDHPFDVGKVPLLFADSSARGGVDKRSKGDSHTQKLGLNLLAHRDNRKAGIDRSFDGRTSTAFKYIAKLVLARIYLAGMESIEQLLCGQAAVFPCYVSFTGEGRSTFTNE